MTNIESEDFLKKYRIETPSRTKLAILHSEAVSFRKYYGYSFSAKALKLIDHFVAVGGLSSHQFNLWQGFSTQNTDHKILFFLDGHYHIADHIRSVRKSLDQIAMTSYFGPDSQKDVIENPPPVGLLFVADVPTLAELATKSPFLGQLLPIADGPPDDEIWAYFLGKADQTELEVGEGAENSKGGNIKKLVCVSSSGEYSC